MVKKVNVRGAQLSEVSEACRVGDGGGRKLAEESTLTCGLRVLVIMHIQRGVQMKDRRAARSLKVAAASSSVPTLNKWIPGNGGERRALGSISRQWPLKWQPVIWARDRNAAPTTRPGVVQHRMRMQ
ncbi:hypothetical protein J6590_017994 [Homalodisca vitripennis]|nr:hypothetical protein J6590_017994 [Homalodisca vitripennis]